MWAKPGKGSAFKSPILKLVIFSRRVIGCPKCPVTDSDTSPVVAYGGQNKRYAARIRYAILCGSVRLKENLAYHFQTSLFKGMASRRLSSMWPWVKKM